MDELSGLRIHFFDDTPAKSGEKHGILGPCHAASVTVDYPYQVEQWAIDAGGDMPHIVRIECPTISRVWQRHGDQFEEVTGKVELTVQPETTT